VNAAELTGRSRSHIAAVPDPECSLHVHAVAPFLNLRRDARSQGFELAPVSSFRDFERQLAIWNDKFVGVRAVHDAAGRLLDIAALSDDERVTAILNWSALPGGSRHHWGTDLDLIDRNSLAPGYRLRLAPDEFAPGGPFADVAAWLDARASHFGFFRPYRTERCGVQPEPWHYSFAPIAELARRRLTAPILREAIESAPLLGKRQVLARLEELHARYLKSVDLP
jgi:LAS superfamily LD-carboxypeptidase LdcB